MCTSPTETSWKLRSYIKSLQSNSDIQGKKHIFECCSIWYACLHLKKKNQGTICFATVTITLYQCPLVRIYRWNLWKMRPLLIYKWRETPSWNHRHDDNEEDRHYYYLPLAIKVIKLKNVQNWPRYQYKIMTENLISFAIFISPQPDGKITIFLKDSPPCHAFHSKSSFTLFSFLPACPNWILMPEIWPGWLLKLSKEQITYFSPALYECSCLVKQS